MAMNGTGLSRRTLLVASCALAASSLAPAAHAAALTQFRPTGGARFDHTAFDRLLKRHVKPDASRYNRVDYRALKSGGADSLRQYVTALSAVDPTRLSPAEAHAFWINLYNAKTIEIVVERYPVASIRKIDLGGGGLFKSGPWSARVLTVGGTALSLDDIEHGIVRPLFGDPMSHYGLNCASYSCPNLATEAYTGANIEAVLAQGAHDYVNHRRGVDVAEDAITASNIYSWYADDFGGEGQLKAHWRAFATPDLARRLQGASIRSYAYDWSLNDV